MSTSASPAQASWISSDCTTAHHHGTASRDYVSSPEPLAESYGSAHCVGYSSTPGPYSSTASSHSMQGNHPQRYGCPGYDAPYYCDCPSCTSSVPTPTNAAGSYHHRTNSYQLDGSFDSSVHLPEFHARHDSSLSGEGFDYSSYSCGTPSHHHQASHYCDPWHGNTCCPPPARRMDSTASCGSALPTYHEASTSNPPSGHPSPAPSPVNSVTNRQQKPASRGKRTAEPTRKDEKPTSALKKTTATTLNKVKPTEPRPMPPSMQEQSRNSIGANSTVACCYHKRGHCRMGAVCWYRHDTDPVLLASTPCHYGVKCKAGHADLARTFRPDLEKKSLLTSDAAARLRKGIDGRNAEVQAEAVEATVPEVDPSPASDAQTSTEEEPLDVNVLEASLSACRVSEEQRVADDVVAPGEQVVPTAGSFRSDWPVFAQVNCIYRPPVTHADDAAAAADALRQEREEEAKTFKKRFPKH